MMILEIHSFAPKYTQTAGPTFTISSSKRHKPSFRAPSTLHNQLQDNIDEDEELLQSVNIEQLQELCHQYSIPLQSTDTKTTLLQKLRSYAGEEAQLDKERKQEQVERARDEGVDMNDVTEDDLEGTFFYVAPVNPNEKKTKDHQEGKVFQESLDEKSYKEMNVPSSPSSLSLSSSSSSSSDIKDDTKSLEERVVTIFNSKDTNDLTGFNPASMPGQEIMNSGSVLGSIEGGESATTTSFLQKNQNQNALPTEDFGDAEEQCIQLIQTILLKTGLPGFFMDHEDEEDDDDNDEESSIGIGMPSTYQPFDPTSVQASLLQRYTPSLIAHDGRALRSALDQIELNAIGQDGMNADDIRKNGGHYREARKVGVFLEGYRIAEVRRMSRETVSQLLDALVTGGVRELDRMMNTMVQAGVVDDTLVLYLTDLVRQQEQKVLQSKAQESITIKDKSPQFSDKDQSWMDTQSQLEEVNDAIIEWNQTKDSKGQIIEETIDPNDPEVRAAIMKTSNVPSTSASQTISNDQSASEKILFLLRLLRERVKAEAAFFKGSGTEQNEHGMNLRVLAYCIYSKSDMERQQILSEQLGSSMDKMDSFLELVKKSIAFAESTTSQIAPGNSSGELDLPLLQKIEIMVEEMKEMQSFQAAGGSITNSDPNIGGDFSVWQ